MVRHFLYKDYTDKPYEAISTCHVGYADKKDNIIYSVYLIERAELAK